MKTVKSIIDTYKTTLRNHYDEKEIMQFIYILFSEYLSWSKTQVINAFDSELSDNYILLFDSSLKALKCDKPIQYIIGKTWFNGNEYFLTPDVLIPRPETEELCIHIKNDNLHRQYQEFSILDIGTGSGIIAIDLKLRFPYAKVKAVDISSESLSIAQINAEKNKCDIDFQRMDIFSNDEYGSSEKFDLIVSNPPYVLESERSVMHPNVIEYEPSKALFVPDDNPLLFYNVISDFANKYLKRPGDLYFEINERFGGDVRSLLMQKGFERIEVLRDIHGKERFVKAELKLEMHDTSYWYADKG